MSCCSDVVVNRPAAELAYRAVSDDVPHLLSELRGKVVVLNLWATWCPPCRRELPDVDRLQKTYAGKGLVVVTLSNEERTQLLEFAATHPSSTLNVYTSDLGWLEVDGRPLSLVIDREGVVRSCFIGARSYAEFEREIGPSASIDVNRVRLFFFRKGRDRSPRLCSGDASVLDDFGRGRHPDEIEAGNELLQHPKLAPQLGPASPWRVRRQRDGRAIRLVCRE